MAEKRLALIIASYQYEDAELRQLIAPAQDAETLARVISDPVIGGFEAQILLNEPSYRVNQTIEAFFTDRKRDDLLLLYFSGHGIKDEDGRLYFATPDTRRKTLRTTAIPATLVNDVMRTSRSRRQVLLLDCCYSGAFARGMVAKAADKEIGTKERFKESGRVVLTGSDAMQYSYEGDKVAGEGVRSVFTRTLVHGLETGEADLDGDGRISLDELYKYVHERVTDQTPQQRPGKWDFDVQGEIVIARNPRPVVKPAELPPELRQSIEDTRPWVREGAVRELDRLLRGSHKGLALAAQIALKRLSEEDDSLRVRTAGAEILAAHPAAELKEKVAPVVEQEREPSPAPEPAPPEEKLPVEPAPQVVEQKEARPVAKPPSPPAWPVPEARRVYVKLPASEIPARAGKVIKALTLLHAVVVLLAIIVHILMLSY